MTLEHSTQFGRRRGSVFILTLAVLIVLASLAMVLARTMTVEAKATSNYVAKLQAEAVAHGAIEYLKVTLQGNDGTMPDETSLLAQAVPVGDGYFWLLKRDFQNSNTWAFGLTDEQGKFNLNGTELETLARLPNMTYELAAGIVDWHDDNEEAEAGGAESAYYATLPSPYVAKNELFESVDELGLVKDMTPAVLYGEDVNRNGYLDANENDADDSDPPDNRDGQLDYGLTAFVTIYNSQAALDAQGQTRVNVNTGNQLTAVLAEAVEPSRVQQVMSDVRGNRPFQNLIDFYYRAGLQEAEFQKIEDRLTTGAAQSLALVNLNTAPPQVLAAMPGLTDSDVQAIIARQKASDPLKSLTDVIKLLEKDKAIAIGGMVTTKSYCYSADIVATDGKGRAFKRLQVVFDAQTTPPKLLYMRDLTALGWPLDPQILVDLRSGQPLATAGVATSSLTGAP